MGPPETENRVQGTPKRHFSSPAPGLREPTRHLSPALPAHTPLTPAALRALPPPTLRLPPLPAAPRQLSKVSARPRGWAGISATSPGLWLPHL